MRLLRDLWSTSRRHTGLVALLIVLGAAGQAVAAALAGPVLVDRSVPLFTALAVALAAATATDLGVGLLVARLTADWSAAARRRLCRVALGQPLPTLEETPVGELLDRIDSDVNQVANELRHSGVQVVRDVVTGLVSALVALVVWWPAGVAMLVASALIAVTVGPRAGRIAAARMAEEEAWSDVAAVMEEAVHGQDDVRTSLARPYVLQLYARRAATVLQRGRRVWRMAADLFLVARMIVRTGIALVVAAAAWALLTGRADGGRVSAVWLLALGFGLVVERIGHLLPELQYGLGAWNRVQNLGDAPQEPVGGAVPRAGVLAVQGLTVRYAPGAAPALDDVHLTFVPGRSYAVIGRSGSGKSTLAKALTRAVDLPHGAVTLAGTDLLDLDVEALRRWIAVVPQRTDILAGTLAENVALFDPQLLDRTATAMHELGLDRWVADLPDGMDTRLGDGGQALSAGQEQLVAFARILVRDPRVIVLDEATARMDPVTEARVQRATERLLRGRIGIVIAHRLSSVQRCDEVVVLADGSVLEAGPLARSRRFADLLALSRSGQPLPAAVTGGVAVLDAEPSALTPPALLPPSVPSPSLPPSHPPPTASRSHGRVEPPPLPDPPEEHTLREILRLLVNDPTFGLGSAAIFTVMVVLGLDGSVLPWLWARFVTAGDGASTRDAVLAAAAIVAVLLGSGPIAWFPGIWYPEWWNRQSLRIGIRLVHGQTGPRRISPYTPAEVVAQGGDTERVVMLADNVVDQIISALIVVAMTAVTRSVVPGLFFLTASVLSGVAALGFGPRLEGAARRTVAARAAFATALVSGLSSARTVKLAGAVAPVLAHLARLDAVRSERQRREIGVQVWARSTPMVTAGLLPIAVWGLYLGGHLSAAATLVTVSTLASARWFAWTTASLISYLPSARVWTRRTATMTGEAAYSSAIPGVDLGAGTAPEPRPAPRHELRRLDLRGFAAVHEDGTEGVRGVDLTVERGQLVLVTGPVGSGKSSLLRALAGIVHHDGELRWNGRPVVEPELFLRPNQVAYVAQLPRVLSGTVAENIRLGHEVDAAGAVATARLEHDLASSGLGLRIGHKGTRLSGGQLQRLALARALAPRTELLVADDVSSALDVTTELELWQALRAHGVTVIGSTSKRAALAQADVVLVLDAGAPVAVGPWTALEPTWSHLAG